MALFKRKAKTPAVIPELEWYNKAEKKERAGLAWLLAVVSIAVAVLIIIGLFFGGRWAYRHFKNQDKPETTQTETQDDPVEQNPVETTPPAPAPTPTPAPTATPAAPTPAVANQQLANTGPASTLAIFVGVTLLSVLAYQFKLRTEN